MNKRRLAGILFLALIVSWVSLAWLSPDDETAWVWGNGNFESNPSNPYFGYQSRAFQPYDTLIAVYDTLETAADTSLISVAIARTRGVDGNFATYYLEDVWLSDSLKSGGNLWWEVFGFTNAGIGGNGLISNKDSLWTYPIVFGNTQPNIVVALKHHARAIGSALHADSLMVAISQVGVTAWDTLRLPLYGSTGSSDSTLQFFTMAGQNLKGTRLTWSNVWLDSVFTWAPSSPAFDTTYATINRYTLQVRLKNPAVAETLTVSRLYPEMFQQWERRAFWTLSDTTFTIAPGEEDTVTMVFDPEQLDGPTPPVTNAHYYRWTADTEWGNAPKFTTQGFVGGMVAWVSITDTLGASVDTVEVGDVFEAKFMVNGRHANGFRSFQVNCAPRFDADKMVPLWMVDDDSTNQLGQVCINSWQGTDRGERDLQAYAGLAGMTTPVNFHAVWSQGVPNVQLTWPNTYGKVGREVFRIRYRAVRKTSSPTNIWVTGFKNGVATGSNHPFACWQTGMNGGGRPERELGWAVGHPFAGVLWSIWGEGLYGTGQFAAKEWPDSLTIVANAAGDTIWDRSNAYPDSPGNSKVYGSLYPHDMIVARNDTAWIDFHLWSYPPPEIITLNLESYSSTQLRSVRNDLAPKPFNLVIDSTATCGVDTMNLGNSITWRMTWSADTERDDPQSQWVGRKIATLGFTTGIVVAPGDTIDVPIVIQCGDSTVASTTPTSFLFVNVDSTGSVTTIDTVQVFPMRPNTSVQFRPPRRGLFKGTNFSAQEVMKYNEEFAVPRVWPGSVMADSALVKNQATLTLHGSYAGRAPLGAYAREGGFGWDVPGDRSTGDLDYGRFVLIRFIASPPGQGGGNPGGGKEEIDP